MRAKYKIGLMLFVVALTLFDRKCRNNIEYGIASYYSDYFVGRTTANGEIFAQTKLTAAHKTLPFNTIVTVTNLDNCKTVTVRINDRGPFIEGRIIDLTKAAADSLSMLEKGITNVLIEY